MKIKNKLKALVYQLSNFSSEETRERMYWRDGAGRGADGVHRAGKNHETEKPAAA